MTTMAKIRIKLRKATKDFLAKKPIILNIKNLRIILELYVDTI